MAVLQKRHGPGPAQTSKLLQVAFRKKAILHERCSVIFPDFLGLEPLVGKPMCSIFLESNRSSTGSGPSESNRSPTDTTPRHRGPGSAAWRDGTGPRRSQALARWGGPHRAAKRNVGLGSRRSVEASDFEEREKKQRCFGEC